MSRHIGWRSFQSGFTLIEVMAVVFIISVLIGLVSVRVGGQGERRLEIEGQRIYQKIRLVIDEAESIGVEMGIQFTDDGYEFYQFDDSEYKWIPAEDQELSPVLLEKEYRITLESGQKLIDTKILYKALDKEEAVDYGEEQEDPDIIFFSDGEITPFKLKLSRSDIPKTFYIITGASSGSVRINKNDM